MAVHHKEVRLMSILDTLLCFLLFTGGMIIALILGMPNTIGMHEEVEKQERLRSQNLTTPKG